MRIDSSRSYPDDVRDSRVCGDGDHDRDDDDAENGACDLRGGDGDLRMRK